MGIYISVLTLIFLCNFLYLRKKETPFLEITCFLSLLLVSGLRAKTVGTDTTMYVQYFLTEDFEVNIELGFKYLINIIKVFTNDYHYFLFFASCLQLIPLFIFFKKLSYNVPYSLLIFYLAGFYFFTLSGLRQSVATSFILLALYYYLDKRYLYAILLFIVSVHFHTTALLMIPIVAVAKYLTIDFKKAVIALVISGVIGYFDLLQIRSIIEFFGHSDFSQSIDVTERYRGYGSYKEDIVKGPLKLLWDMLPNTILCVIFYKITDGKKHLFRDIFFVGVIISNIFITFSINSRIALYTIVIQTILVPNLFFYYSRKKLATQLYISYLIFFFFYTLYIAYAYGVTPYRNDIVPYNFLG